MSKTFLSGIDAITFAVQDIGVCQQFFLDLGLRTTTVMEHKVVMVTQDGSQVILKSALMTQNQQTVESVIWGLSIGASLGDYVALLRSKGLDIRYENGVYWCHDPSGLAVGFRFSVRSSRAIDNHVAASRYKRPRPVSLSHVVFNVQDLQAHRQFYCDTLGFIVSDEYINRGAFLRCQRQGYHHDLFLLKKYEDIFGFNHLAFTFAKNHQVGTTAKYMAGKQWSVELGPAYHEISSAFFYTLTCPAGGVVELCSDGEFLNEAWQPRQIDPDKTQHIRPAAQLQDQTAK